MLLLIEEVVRAHNEWGKLWFKLHLHIEEILDVAYAPKKLFWGEECAPGSTATTTIIIKKATPVHFE